MGTGTNIGRVRGLGSANEGAHHWILQRITAVANLALVVWLVTSLVLLPSYDYSIVSTWLAQPIVAIPMILLLISVFWHVRLGLQVLIEDYAHDSAPKIILLILLNFFVFGGAAIGIFAVTKVAFTGA